MITLFDIISQAGKNSSDGYCSMFRVLHESGCDGNHIKEMCQKNKQCEYDPVYGKRKHFLIPPIHRP